MSLPHWSQRTQFKTPLCSVSGSSREQGQSEPPGSLLKLSFPDLHNKDRQCTCHGCAFLKIAAISWLGEVFYQFLECSLPPPGRFVFYFDLTDAKPKAWRSELNLRLQIGLVWALRYHLALWPQENKLTSRHCDFLIRIFRILTWNNAWEALLAQYSDYMRCLINNAVVNKQPNDY